MPRAFAEDPSAGNRPSPVREVSHGRTGSDSGMADDVELTLVTDVGAQGDDLVEGPSDLHTGGASEVSHRHVNPVLNDVMLRLSAPFPVLCPGG